MPLTLSFALLASTGLQSAPAVAPPGGQVAGAESRNISAEQIRSVGPGPAVEALPQDTRPHLLVVQVAPGEAAQVRSGQINAEARRASGSPQLESAPRSAGAPPSPAARSEGRRTELVRVGGSDRCDPQAAEAAEARCRRVIETRSAEFSGPAAPTLSPEQRLLRDQDRAPIRSVSGAAQRVGRNDVDPNAVDTQALAAISLGRQRERSPPPVADAQSGAGADAIIRIIEAAQSAPPRP